jgi:hypothetical protein
MLLTSSLTVGDLLSENIAAVLVGADCDTRCFSTLFVDRTQRSAHLSKRLNVLVDHDLGSGWGRGSTTPGTDGVRTSLLPCVRDRWEVLAVCCPCYEYTETGSRKDIEGVVTSVHNTRTGDESSTQGGDHHNERPPNFAFGVHDVQLRGKVEGEVKESGKRDYCVLAQSGSCMCLTYHCYAQKESS